MKIPEWLERWKKQFHIWCFKVIHKDKLPLKFDVFCIGDMSFDYSNEKIPGTLYVSGRLDASDLTICDTLIVDGCIDANDLFVYSSCISGEDIKVANATVFDGDFISKGDIDAYSITVIKGSCFALHSIDSFNINIDDTLDCYDVVAYGHEIYAYDYVCRYYEEEI